jgi:hypothetical protein
MPCPGLHCPGCSRGQSAGILAAALVGLAVADELVQWVADRIWWIGGTAAVAFALAVAASMWLEGWHARRGARFAAAHGILSRADVILPDPVRTGNRDFLSRPAERPALGFRDLHIHLDGVPSAEQSAVIRQALNGTTSQP